MKSMLKIFLIICLILSYGFAEEPIQFTTEMAKYIEERTSFGIGTGEFFINVKKMLEDGVNTSKLGLQVVYEKQVGTLTETRGKDGKTILRNDGKIVRGEIVGDKEVSVITFFLIHEERLKTLEALSAMKIKKNKDGSMVIANLEEVAKIADQKEMKPFWVYSRNDGSKGLTYIAGHPTYHPMMEAFKRGDLSCAHEAFPGAKSISVVTVDRSDKNIEVDGIKPVDIQELYGNEGIKILKHISDTMKANNLAIPAEGSPVWREKK